MELLFYVIYFLWCVFWSLFMFEETFIEGKYGYETWSRFEFWNENIGIKKGSFLSWLLMFFWWLLGWYLPIIVLKKLGWLDFLL